MGVADPLETRFFQTRVIVPNLVGVGRTVWVLAGTQKNRGTLGPRFLGMGCGWPSRNTLLSHMGHRTKFGHSSSNYMGVRTLVSSSVSPSWTSWSTWVIDCVTFLLTWEESFISIMPALADVVIINFFTASCGRITCALLSSALAQRQRAINEKHRCAADERRECSIVVATTRRGRGGDMAADWDNNNNNNK